MKDATIKIGEPPCGITKVKGHDYKATYIHSSVSKSYLECSNFDSIVEQCLSCCTAENRSPEFIPYFRKSEDCSCLCNVRQLRQLLRL